MESRPVIAPIDKSEVLATIFVWMLSGLGVVIVLTVVMRLCFGHLPEPVGYATMAVMCLTLGPALVRRNQTMGAQFRFLARGYAVAGGALLAIVAGMRALRWL